MRHVNYIDGRPLWARLFKYMQLDWMWGDTAAYQGRPYYTLLRFAHVLFRRI